MSSKTILFLLGALVSIAHAEAVPDDAKEITEFNNEVALNRVVRDADPRKNKGSRRNKGSRKNKGKRRNKASRRNKGSRKNKGVRQMQGRAVDAQCLADATTYINKRENLVKNFDRQLKRIKSWIEKAGKKNSKTSIFTNASDAIVLGGGGNKSNLTCDGCNSNSGANQLTNLTTFLFACPTYVNDSCSDAVFPGLPEVIPQCENDTAAFTAEVEKCLEEQETDAGKACDECWKSETIANLSEAIRACKIKPTQDAVKAQYKLCIGKFGECKKYEDAGVPALAACAAGKDGLLKQAGLTNANVVALKSALNAIKTLAGSRRTRRATPTTCTEVITLVYEVIALVSSDTADPSIATKANEISAASSLTCTTEEKAKLKELESSVEADIETTEQALAAIQELLEGITGSTASTSELESSASATAASSSRRGNIVKKMLMNMH